MVQAIGDTVMAIPALRTLRKEFRHAEIIMLCQSWVPKLLQNIKIVDKFIIVKVPWTRAADRSFNSMAKLIKTTLSLRKEKIDLSIHFRGDPRSIFLMYLSGAKKRISYGEYFITNRRNWLLKNVGRQFLTDIVPIQNKKRHIMDCSLEIAKYMGGKNNDLNNISLPISKGQMNYANSFLQKLNINPEIDTIIGIHPGHFAKVRGWKIERWKHIIKYIQQKGVSAKVLVFGSTADKDMVNKLVIHNSDVVAVMKPLEYLPAFIKLCNLIICLDSSASHIAAAVDTHSIVLFGPNEPSISAPRSDKAKIVIKEGFDCRPCSQKGCPFSIDKKIGACMDAISVNDVIRSVDNIIQYNLIN